MGIQTTLDKVLAAGYYGDHNHYMCHALYDAFTEDVITRIEYDVALEAVQGYVREICPRYSALFGALYQVYGRQMRHGLYDASPLYADWKHRPRFTKGRSPACPRYLK